MPRTHEGLCVDNVWVTAEHRVLLRGVTLRITERRVAVLGCNGAGKSTLLKLLSGIITPSSGTVAINGVNGHKGTLTLRNNVAFVCSDPLSQLRVPPPAADLDQPLRRFIDATAKYDPIVLPILESFNLARLAGRSVYELSGGERHLLGMVRSLAANPNIVVLDEPSVLMDYRNTLRVRRFLGSLTQQLIVATHDLDLAAESDRVIVLHDGSVVFDGAPDLGIKYFTDICSDFAEYDNVKVALGRVK